MSRFKGRNKNRSYFVTGSQAGDDDSTWAPRIDKNPFYRTMDIFNGVFNKKIRLAAGPLNSTDGHTIFVNFNELRPSPINRIVRSGKDDSHTVFMLDCGHEWEGRTKDKNGVAKEPGRDYVMCGVCGGEQIYRGFEHEWQHIIFKSDLAARKIFCEQYAEQLLKQAPGVDRDELVGFLAILTNAFDDLRVNSLWEKVYPGSAQEIWDRWRNFTFKMGAAVNENFISYVFAVAFGMPTDPQGQFEAMRPAVEWAVKKVKYKGFANMLIDVRVMLDRCMGALLAKMQPPAPPPTMQPPPPPSMAMPDPQQQQQGGQQDNGDKAEGQEERGGQEGSQDPQGARGGSQGGLDTQGDSQGDGQDQGSEDEGSDSQQAGASSAQAQAGAVGNQPQGSSGSGTDQEGNDSVLGGIPSGQSVQANEQERTDALQKLMAGAQVLDDKEEHGDPTDEDLKQALASHAVRAMLMKALNHDIQNLDAVETKLPTGIVDEDMQKQLDQLATGIASRSEASLLTGNAKAKISIINVTKDGIGTGGKVELDSEERFFVTRMRSAFYRSLGRQKAKRSPTGTQVDVQSLIQYRGDHQDPNVFENEDVNQGFAYSVLCDMSGSMQSTYPTVCKAVEMLKEALRFPFVVGNLWGFRGGQYVPGFSGGSGDVWMYRYDKNVNWYTGMVTVKRDFTSVQVPVQCGGITPMNSAINVASAHLWRKMPSGMAKRMFLLTDGSPLQTRVTGSQIPDYVLRQFVAKEIREARKHGIQVYTIVIGDKAIPEKQCLQMFGPRKFWRRVGEEKVGTVLSSLVLANFNKYIKARG